MPSTQSKRDVILKTSIASGTVADLTASYDALLDGTAAGAIVFQDESGTKDEKTKYKLVFTSGTSSVGSMTIKFVADVTLPTGSSATAAKVRAGYTQSPTGREGGVTLLDTPTTSYERIWKQNVRDSARNEVADHVVKLDVRVKAESGYTVEQTVKSNDAGELVLIYEFASATTGAVLTGSVTLTPSVAPGAGYTVGAPRVTDNSPTTGSVRIR